MKKLLSLTLALAVVAVPGVSLAGKARTESGEYNTLVVEPNEDEPSAAGGFSNGVAFTPRKGERFIEVVIEDQLGMPTRASVAQDLDGDGVDDISHEVCGASEAPIKFRRGIDIHVSAQEGPCADGTTAMATFGTITATFTR